MLITANKIAETPTSTLSRVTIEGRFLGFFIEDGANEVKEWGRTRIPGGRYEIVRRYWGKHYERYKSRYGHEYSFEIKNVPNYTGIIIHIGNDISDTEGCPLINYAALYNKEEDRFRGFYSTPAYKDFYELLKTAFDAELRVFIDINR